MNKNITKIWTSTTVDERELEWMRLLIPMASKTNKESIKSFGILLEELLNDKEYQKVAIAPMKDVLGNTVVRGTATITLLLLFAKRINKEILDELLYNLLFIYHDKENEIPLALTYDILGQRYLPLIVTNKDIKLKKEYQEKIAECISKLANSIKEEDTDFKTDTKVITAFLLRHDIAKSLKEKVVKEFTEEVDRHVCENLNKYLYEYFGLSVEDFVNNESVLSEVFELLR